MSFTSLDVMPTARTRKKRPAMELEMERDLEQEWLEQKERRIRLESDSLMQHQQQNLLPLPAMQMVPVPSSSSFCEPQSPNCDAGTDIFSHEPPFDETDLESFFNAFNINPQLIASSNHHLLLDNDGEDEDTGIKVFLFSFFLSSFFFLLFSFFTLFASQCHSANGRRG